jgi:hypothetical protein
MERQTIQALIRHIAAAVDAAPAFYRPFHHLVLDRVFPDDTYAAMLELMPTAADYRRCRAGTRKTSATMAAQPGSRSTSFPNTRATSRQRSGRSGRAWVRRSVRTR